MILTPDYGRAVRGVLLAGVEVLLVTSMGIQNTAPLMSQSLFHIHLPVVSPGGGAGAVRTVWPTRSPRPTATPPSTIWPTPVRTLASPTAAPTRLPPVTPVARATFRGPDPQPPPDVYGDCVVTTVERKFGPDSDWSSSVVTYNHRSAPIEDASTYTSGGALFQVVTHWQYDPSGVVLREESDEGGDGSLDKIRTWSYDSWNRLIRVETDLKADRSIDSVRRFTYNDFGDLLREEEDVDADGLAEDIESHSYDEEGHRIRTSSDLDADGQPEYQIVLSWRDGHLVRHEFIHPDGELIAPVGLYIYDPTGRLARIEDRDAPTWTLSAWHDFEYEQHGWLASEEYYRGHLDYSARYFYDSDGRLTAIQYPVYGGDTTVDSRCPAAIPDMFLVVDYSEPASSHRKGTDPSAFCLHWGPYAR